MIKYVDSFEVNKFYAVQPKTCHDWVRSCLKQNYFIMLIYKDVFYSFVYENNYKACVYAILSLKLPRTKLVICQNVSGGNKSKFAI